MRAAVLGGTRPLRAAAGSARTGWRLAFVGTFVGALLALLVGAPARWLASALADATGGRLQLVDAQGTVWSGSAVLTMTGGPGSRDATQLPGRLAWTTALRGAGLELALLHAPWIAQSVHLRLEPRWGGGVLSLRAGGRSADEAAARSGERVLLQGPTSLLVGLGAPFNSLGLGGTLQCRSPEGLRVESVRQRARLAGGLVCEALAASSTMAPVPVLGSYRVELSGAPLAAAGASADAGMRLRLSTLAGPLMLAGDGGDSGGVWRFRGTAQAEPGHELELANLLNIIGRRQGAVSILAFG